VWNVGKLLESVANAKTKSQETKTTEKIDMKSPTTTRANKSQSQSLHAILEEATN